MTATGVGPNEMSTSYGALCDDFYVNINLRTQLELPRQRDTVLHYFEQLRKRFPRMGSFYVNDDGDFCLEEDREAGAYRWMAVEKQRLCSGHVNPDELEDAYQQHAYALEQAQYNLSISPLDVDCLDVLFGMDFIYAGNHHAVAADALMMGSPVACLLDEPDTSAIECEPHCVVSLSADCRLQARVSIQTRTGAYEARTGNFREDAPLSVYLTIRQYPHPDEPFDFLAAFHQQRQICEDLLDRYVIPRVARPIADAIASNPR